MDSKQQHEIAISWHDPPERASWVNTDSCSLLQSGQHLLQLWLWSDTLQIHNSCSNGCMSA